MRMSLSLKLASREMTLYHSLRAAGHGRRRLAAAAPDRDAAARMKPATGRDIGRVGQGVAEPDIRHAAPRLRGEHACEQRLRVGMARRTKQRVGLVALDDAAEIHHGD